MHVLRQQCEKVTNVLRKNICNKNENVLKYFVKNNVNPLLILRKSHEILVNPVSLGEVYCGGKIYISFSHNSFHLYQDKQLKKTSAQTIS